MPIKKITPPWINKSSTGDKFYKTTAWKNYRRDKKKEQRQKDLITALSLHDKGVGGYFVWLKKDNPLCAECVRNNRIKSGFICDHIQARSQGGGDFGPVQWLCRSCDNSKRQSENYNIDNNWRK